MSLRLFEEAAFFWSPAPFTTSHGVGLSLWGWYWALLQKGLLGLGSMALKHLTSGLGLNNLAMSPGTYPHVALQVSPGQVPALPQGM